jgi:hypothetical protein
MLNTIVGLIVDSFGALRQEAESREVNLETQAFISCMDRQTIETIAQSQDIHNGFEHHETKLQNKWEYMAFIFHLFETDEEDYTGVEQEIRALVDQKDVKWLPIGRSKLVEDSAGGADAVEDVVVRIDKKVNYINGIMDAGRDQRLAMSDIISNFIGGVDERISNVENGLREVKNLITARDQLQKRPQKCEQDHTVRRPAEARQNQPTAPGRRSSLSSINRAVADGLTGLSDGFTDVLARGTERAAGSMDFLGFMSSNNQR